jgi:hypothetical protein
MVGGTARGQRILTTEPFSSHAAMVRGRLLEVGESVEDFLARPAGWKRDKLPVHTDGGGRGNGSRRHLGAREAD